MNPSNPSVSRLIARGLAVPTLKSRGLRRAVVLGVLAFASLAAPLSAQSILKVSVMPSNSQSSSYAKAGLNETIAIWGRTWGGIGALTYNLNFGDGTAAATGSVTNANYISASHTYTTGGLKTFTLTVTDSTAATISRSGTLRVIATPLHSDRVHMAINKGLMYLYQNYTVTDANRIYWSWGANTPGGYYVVGATSASILAFEENDHLPGEDDVEEIYAETLRRGLNTLFGLATAYNIGAAQHSDGIAVRDTDMNDNGRGIYLNTSGGHGAYATPFAGMAIILAKRNAAEAQASTVPYGPFAGTNYNTFVQDMVDQMHWSQGDGTYRGGYEYSVTTASPPRYDGSSQQWPALMLLAAKERLNIQSPQWWLDNAAHGFNVLQDATTGGIGYSNTSGWRNLAKTGGALALYSLAGRLAGTDANATKARNYIQNRWLSDPSWSGDHAGWAGQWYAMWGLKKGLQTQGITTLETSTGARNWVQDMQAWLLGNATLLDSQGAGIPTSSSFRTLGNMFGQAASGKWSSAVIPGTNGLPVDTAHAVLILSEAIARPVPVAVIDPVSSQPITSRPFGMIGANSYHLDANSALIEYLWDWDASNGVDWANPGASGPLPTNPGYALVGNYTVTLRVKDNQDPQETSTRTLVVKVISGDIEPFAVAIPASRLPAYSAQVGQPIQLDGRGSFDPNDDVITLYEWDSNGDGIYSGVLDVADGAMPTITFMAPYTGQVGLRVTANGKISTNNAIADIYASPNDFYIESISSSNIVFGSSADVQVVVKNAANSMGTWNGVAVRFFNGDPLVNGVQIGGNYTVNLAPEGTATLNVSLTNLNGLPKVYAYVDSTKAIPEWDERNNTASVNVVLPPTVTLNTANLANSATTLTITGTGFSTTPANNLVVFAPAGTGTVTAATATSLTVTSLSGLSLGALSAVVTANGLNSGGGVQVATVIPPPPTVTAIAPTSGPTAGGTSVTITGTNFTGATGVTIGGVAATSVVVVSPTSITCIAPAGTAGTASVLVTTAGGTNAANSLFTYVVVPPTVTLNTAGLSSSATTLTITGTNFDAVTPGNNTVVFTPAGTGTVTASTATSLTVTSLSGLTLGNLNAVVTTNSVSSGAAVQVATVGDIFLSQTLCFTAPLEAPTAQALPLYGYATSGLNVEFTVLSGPGTVSGNLLTFTGQGDVVVRASQPGDLTYLPAATVNQTIKSVSLAIPEGIADGWNVQYGAGAASKANAIAMKLSGQSAQFVAVTGYVTGAGGKRDLYVSKRVAVTGVEVWAKTHAGAAGLDDEGTAVAFDSAGNVVVAGQATNAAGNTDIVVIKYAAADGAVVWSNIFMGTDGVTDNGADAVGSYDGVNRQLKGRKNLAIGPTDEVIVGGYVTNAGAGRDLVVVKYNSGGTKAWSNYYDGAGGIDYANAVAVDASGNVFAGGGSRAGTSVSTLDGVALKYAVDGTLVWHERYDNGKPDEVTSLMIDRDGNPVVSGYTQQATYDMFVVRYNQAVDPSNVLRTTILWATIFNNPGSTSSEAVWDMVLVFGKDVMLTGTSYPANGLFNGYTIRFKGTCVDGARWDRTYGDVAGKQDQMVAMGADYFGSPVTVGYAQVADGRYVIQAIKYRAEDGGFLWSKRYESAAGNSEPTAVVVDPAGNVFMAGYTTVAGGVTKVLLQNYSTYTNPSRTAQTITFPNPGAQLAGNAIMLGATSSSGLQVEYAVVSGAAAVIGNTLTLNGAGAVTLRASQSGSGDYQPAAAVEVTFSVSQSTQTISFNLPAKIYQVNGAWEPFALSGVTSSALTVTYAVVSGAATITGGVLQLSGTGAVTVRASQVGDSSFAPAASVERTVTGEVLGTFTILDGFRLNWRDRSLRDVADAASAADGEAVALALKLTGYNATAGYVAGYVNGVNGKDLFLTKYTHDVSTGAAAQSWVRQVNGSASGNDEAKAVAVDTAGNVIVAGYVTTATGADVYVAKYNSNGGSGVSLTEPIWTYTFNGSGNGTDVALSIALLGTTQVVVGGQAAGSGTGNDFFAAKLNAADGTVVWTKESNRSGTTSDIPAKVAVGSDGGVVLTGASGSDAWTVKLASADGSLVWQNVYNPFSKPDAMRALALDGANNVIVAGYSQGTNYDMYTAKYEADTGVIVWGKRYNGSFSSSDAAWDVIVDRQGNALVTGTSYRAAGVRDGMTIKYNGLDGTVQWAKRPFGNVGTVSANDENFSIALDGIGNLVVVGYTTNVITGVDYYVARHLNNGGGTDGESKGEAVFDGYYNSADYIYQVKMDPNGAIWMAGYTTKVSGERQPMVVRLAPGP